MQSLIKGAGNRLASEALLISSKKYAVLIYDFCILKTFYYTVKSYLLIFYLLIISCLILLITI